MWFLFWDFAYHIISAHPHLALNALILINHACHSLIQFALTESLLHPPPTVIRFVKGSVEHRFEAIAGRRYISTSRSKWTGGDYPGCPHVFCAGIVCRLVDIKTADVDTATRVCSVGPARRLRFRLPVGAGAFPKQPPSNRRAVV